MEMFYEPVTKQSY